MKTEDINIFDYRRIMIIGNNGSGKSYLAKKLAMITGLPLIHLDAHFWQPNWDMPTKDQWHSKMEEFTEGEKWIIDGVCSHGDTLEMRFKRADFIIFLDINRFVCLLGVMKRQGKKREDTAEGHQTDEKFDRRFLGFCRGILNFNKTRKVKLMDLHEKHLEKPFLTIDSRKEMNRMVDKWEKDRASLKED